MLIIRANLPMTRRNLRAYLNWKVMKEGNDFFVESSYGTLSFTTLTPTQTLPKSKLWYEQAGQRLIDDSAIELAGVNGFDVANYDVIMIAIDDGPGHHTRVGW